MGLGIPPLKIKIMLESNPLKSIVLVRRLTVQSEASSRCAGSKKHGPPTPQVFNKTGRTFLGRGISVIISVKFVHEFKPRFDGVIERLAKYDWKPHRIVAAQQKTITGLCLPACARERERGTASSNPRCQTVLKQ